MFSDPAILHWANLKMSDEDLHVKLQSLPKDQKYRVLLVHNNCLTSLPDFNKYPQLSDIKVINASYNQISEVNEEHLPGTATIMHLRNNNIQTMSPNLVSDWLHNCFDMTKEGKISGKREINLYCNPIGN